MIDRALALADEGASFERAAEALGTSGFVEHTLAMASFAYASRGDGPMEALLPAVCAVGGDTDSIAAIVGAWFGARHGPLGLPSAWLCSSEVRSEPPTSARSRGISAIERGEAVTRPASFSWLVALARNLALYPVVIAHGLRRLAPPYR